MKLKRIYIKRSEINKYTKDDQFFFYMSHWFLSEIITLKQLYYCSMNVHDADGVEVYGRNYRTLFISSLFAAKLWEGWKLLEKSYFPQQLELAYNPLYSGESKQALTDLKNYFGDGGKTLISKIRTSAFHYPAKPKDREDFEKCYRDTDEHDGSEYFIGDAFETSLFGIDQFIANIMNKTGADSMRNAILAINTELQKVSSLFFTFMGEHILHFQKKCGFDQENVWLKDVAARAEISIPFFMKDRGHSGDP